MKRAVFPGSFDPITKGHEDVIKRAIPLFDEVIVAIGINHEKKNYFDLESRIGWLKEVFKDYPNVCVDSYTGLTVDYCRNIDAQYIIRGLRTSADFEFEKTVGQVNKQLYSGIETVFLLTSLEYTSLNSSIVRDVHHNGGDVSFFVPDSIRIPARER